ncbi:KOW motif [Methanococcus vannielii SB]|jgi:large subunit ribosomal protein L14e|uniref:Large ribosomal subunit protein eL14 n=1 Tax=Methanococcus vannielii (strain ATCC 35089 / DSM 1224 / JCM 13029 / OCM 148 / SB) TaxID=406327 RepID=RL14E_METVS|nr:50S ribosomal protein L14e [Methanococcus vannielii]A6USC0.1 RecName: Full=Large ribosomal subunit protein eL14; AltName: Full=50S ribosomal protein L14e [Methanococcus vannielii SB]ABR55392.1 KOW motif [Methanococcus vannielii SB]
MAAIEVGRVCIKTLGREAGNVCVIVEVLDKNYIVVDGNVKRRRCNVKHVEPTDKKVELEKGASTEEVKLSLDAAGLL